MKDRDATSLLLKYRNGNCTEEEIAWLESWYLSYKDKPLTDLSPESLDEVRNSIWKTLPVHAHVYKPVRLWPGIAAAVAVIIGVTAGLFFYLNSRDQEAAKKATAMAKIVPGGNRAILTLADGTKVSLTDAANGNLANQSGIVITKAKDGQLIYTVAGPGSVKPAAKIAYNTITTPKGGKYEINLPDGTKAILNSASSLTFPAMFMGNQREVKLAGEGYFEVAPDKARPFKVIAANQTVEVLGTHFNINAYADEESINTTLLEGKVKVNTGSTAVVLRPEEQATLKQGVFKVAKVNAEDAIAWTNNVFVFNNEELGSIMRKISRWYDVEVVCPEEMARTKFAGTVSSKKNIREVLRIMELTETIHFKIEGRRITVMP